MLLNEVNQSPGESSTRYLLHAVDMEHARPEQQHGGAIALDGLGVGVVFVVTSMSHVWTRSTESIVYTTCRPSALPPEVDARTARRGQPPRLGHGVGLLVEFVPEPARRERFRRDHDLVSVC